MIRVLASMLFSVLVALALMALGTGLAASWAMLSIGEAVLASATPAAAEPVHVDALVRIDGVETHLPAAICRMDTPASYVREDGKLTLRLAGVTCADRMFADGFEAPPVPPRLPPGREPR